MAKQFITVTWRNEEIIWWLSSTGCHMISNPHGCNDTHPGGTVRCNTSSLQNHPFVAVKKAQQVAQQIQMNCKSLHTLQPYPTCMQHVVRTWWVGWLTTRWMERWMNVMQFKLQTKWVNEISGLITKMCLAHQQQMDGVVETTPPPPRQPKGVNI